MADAPEVEPLEEFRARARAWLADNMPPLGLAHTVPEHANDERWAFERTLQRTLFDGGFAGLCFPREYGGQGLTPEHQRVLTDESRPYDMPRLLNVPTLGILAATLLELGTHEQKLRHLPPILRGEELWVQFLSEPSGGSDLAGVLTRAERDGDVFVLNGSKVWSSGAYLADWAMCLARTNWDVPKHRGLTMFLMPIHQDGVTVEQIRQVDGSMEFCQEFFDDVAIPVSDVIGEVDDGWTVATRLLVHERNATGGGSPYTSGRSSGPSAVDIDRSIADLALEVGRGTEPHVRQLVGEERARQIVGGQLVRHVTAGMRSGAMPAASSSLLKLFTATSTMRRSDIALQIGGPSAVTWGAGDLTVARAHGVYSLWRQGISLGGGSNEIQRNIISERILGMPREFAADREVPYREVRRAPGRS